MRRLVVVPLLALSIVPVLASTRVGAAIAHPNILFIITDDQRWDTLRSPRYAGLYPNIDRLISMSTYYPEAFVPNSLCCPSRSSTLSGAYSHTTGVYGNRMPYGGFEAFKDTTTIATALHDVGYRTMLAGKYLNQYPGAHWDYVPPGWDKWFAIGGGSYYNYYADNAGTHSRFFGAHPSDYSGSVLTNRALRFLAGAQADGTPSFLYYAPAAPHGSRSRSNIVDPLMPNGKTNAAPMPAPQDVNALAGIAPWRPATYGNKDDVSDMPGYIQRRAWDPIIRKQTDLFRERQLEAMIGVDRNIGQLLTAVDLSTTMVVFMGDNGYLWGEHRWNSKQVPYEEAIRVPMFIHFPGQTGASTDTSLTLNIDLTKTIADLAGIDTATTPIGSDLRGDPVLAEGRDVLVDPPRQDFVLEHESAGSPVPPYCGVRTADGWMFTRYADGFEEMYDVAVDPLEQSNLASDPRYATQEQALKARAMALCDPVPPGFSWTP